MNQFKEKLRIGIDIGSYSIKAQREIGEQSSEDLIWETGEREIDNCVIYSNSRRVGHFNNSVKQNLPQTIIGINCFIANGMDQTFQETMNQNYCTILKQDNELVFQMTYQGREIILRKSQVLATIFNYIRKTLDENKLLEFSIAIPDYFSQAEKQTVIQALQLAEISNYEFIFQSTALVSYFLNSKKEDIDLYLGPIPKEVIFIDIGHASIGVHFVVFLQRDARIIHSACKMDLGVQSLDIVLENYILNDVWRKYQIDIKSNQKLLYRLRQEIQKKRKILSSNSYIDLDLEAFPRDNQNYGIKMNRDSFNNLSADVQVRFENFLAHQIEIASKKNFYFKNLEIQRIGGGSRIPLFQESIYKVLKQHSLTNINGNEYFAAGALCHKYLSQKYNIVQKSNCTYILEAVMLNNEKQCKVLMDQGTYYGSYTNIPFNSEIYKKVDIYQICGLTKNKIFEIDLKNCSQTEIRLRLNELGLLEIESNGISFKEFTNQQQFNEFKEMEDQFVQHEKDSEKIDKIKYEVESQFYQLKQLYNSQFLSQEEKGNLHEVIQDMSNWSQKNAFSYQPLEVYQEKSDYLRIKIGHLIEREEKMKRLQQWNRDHMITVKRFVQNFDVKYGDMMIDAEEDQIMEISKLKWQIMKNLKIINQLVHSNEYHQIDQIDVEEILETLNKDVQNLEDYAKNLI